MSAKATAREKSRLRMERYLQRKREAARLSAIAEAQRFEREAAQAEALAETLAPSIMRKAVLQGGIMLLGPRIEVIGARASWVDPVANLKLTDRQRKAARQIQTDWREVGAGLNVAACDWLRSAGGGSGLGGHAAIRRQIDTRARLDAALAFLGAFTPCVVRVTLDCIPPSVWAAEVGKTVAEAIGWVTAALDRLALFYWPQTQDGPVRERILTIGPPREAYDMSMEPVD